ncbi:MAG TPA: hypothetical protein VJN18_23340 [Polyangiaceae bacterium]|nr:hypothetical protein [Polyangiaceae bacterium]
MTTLPRVTWDVSPFLYQSESSAVRYYSVIPCHPRVILQRLHAMTFILIAELAEAVLKHGPYEAFELLEPRAERCHRERSDG